MRSYVICWSVERRLVVFELLHFGLITSLYVSFVTLSAIELVFIVTFTSVIKCLQQMCICATHLKFYFFEISLSRADNQRGGSERIHPSIRFFLTVIAVQVRMKQLEEDFVYA